MNDKILKDALHSADKADSEGPWMVVRDCCTSGNCATCMAEENHKFGQAVLVAQIHTNCRVKADRCAQNWAAYKPHVVPMNTTSIGILCKSSREYAWQEMERLKIS